MSVTREDKKYDMKDVETFVNAYGGREKAGVLLKLKFGPKNQALCDALNDMLQDNPDQQGTAGYAATEAFHQELCGKVGGVDGPSNAR